MATLAEIQRIVDEHCTKKYFIEYRGFLSNHLAHGIIALYKLGASTRRVLEFVQWYSPRLKSAEAFGFEQNKSEKDTVDNSKFQEIRGKRQDFYLLLSKYDELLHGKYDNKLEEFLRSEFPKMADGIHCAALHPLIHIGYGYSIRSSTVVVEGMAYLHYSYMATKPIPWSNSERNLDILEALTHLKDATAIRGKIKMYAESAEWMPDISGSFQREVGILTTHPWVRGRIQITVESIKLPEWFDVQTAGMGDLLRLMDVVLHWALLVYTCAEKRNDFFLLHGVTGAWSLLQILHTFTDATKAFDSIQYYLATLLSAYVAQDCPAVQLKFLEDPPNSSLDDLRQEALEKTTDEHVYKLVQVCWELGSQNQDAEKQAIYKTACRAAMDYKFPF